MPDTCYCDETAPLTKAEALARFPDHTQVDIEKTADSGDLM
jgi:hypothetical protein